MLLAMGARFAYLAAGIAVAACLAALVGCAGGGTFNDGQRAPWRQEAEDACIASGVVQASAYVVQMTPIDGPGVCGLERPLRVSGLARGSVAVSPPALIDCTLTAGLDRWLQNSVQPAAQRYLGTRVVGLTQIASYGCRGRDGNNWGKISEHAFGNALDIAGFRLANGQSVTVVNGWRGGPPRERAFLQAAFAGACAEFYTVLGPGSDRFHYNHFHVDLLLSNASNGRHYCRPYPGQPMADAASEPAHTASVMPVPFVGHGPN
jgi:hypothetical protein